jgi:lipoprotein signal peptidase
MQKILRWFRVFREESDGRRHPRHSAPNQPALQFVFPLGDTLSTLSIMSIVIPVLAVAFAAFFAWLTMRLINRRERWAIQLAFVAGIMAAALGAVLFLEYVVALNSS